MQLHQREVSRIWNILRFFPKEEIPRSFNAYVREEVKTSPDKCQKRAYIQEARTRYPEGDPTFSEKKKREIYKKLVAPNG